MAATVPLATDVVCLHVPHTYVGSGPEPRMRTLARLHREGRLVMVLGMPPGLLPLRCLWLFIFRDAGTRERLWRGDQTLWFHPSA